MSPKTFFENFQILRFQNVDILWHGATVDVGIYLLRNDNNNNRPKTTGECEMFYIFGLHVNK